MATVEEVAGAEPRRGLKRKQGWTKLVDGILTRNTWEAPLHWWWWQFDLLALMMMLKMEPLWACQGWNSKALAELSMAWKW